MGRIITTFDQEFIKKFEPSLAKKHKGAPRLWIDGHIDLPYFMKENYPNSPIEELEQGPFTITKALEAGVRIFVSAIFCEDRFNGISSIMHFEENLAFTLNHYKGIQIIKNSNDLDTATKDPNYVGTLLLLENADSLTDNLQRVQTLKAEGFFAIGLTHRGRNRLADGDQVTIAEGISDPGKALLRAMMDNHLALDVAHLHPKSFWQALDLFQGPIFCSHTGVAEQFEIPRNINLTQIKELFDRQGIVGISFNPELLGGRCKGTAEDVFIHMDTVVQRFGPEHVAVGSDLGGFEAREEAAVQDIHGFIELAEIMLDHGYGELATEEILGLNWLEFFKRLL